MIGPKQVLERIVSDENFHGIAATSGHGAVTNVAGISSEKPFPIHSVGKILSGVLMVEMVTQGIIVESDLKVPRIRLQPEIEEKLTIENPAVIKRLSQVSILQAMQHTAGLASLNEKNGSKDCIDNYTKHLREGGEERRSMGDMVDFVGDKITEIGKEKYSNDGLLLAGFALQNLYNSRTGQNLSYEEILNKLVIEPSRTNISMTRPFDAHYKVEDAEHLSKYPVTPAGGHFASTDDLLKLGEYLYQRCQDQEFMNGIKKYGAEFYDEGRNSLYHGGYMEGTTVEAKGSATEFAVSLNDGKTIVILMDRDASEDDRNSGRLTQTHARGFYKELRNSLEQERISSQTPQPKFPHNISVVDQVDSSSVGVDRDREFPIMSISKSFCGAVSALMAVDDKFGSNGIDATISEALTAAIQNYPGRQEIIEQYLQMLEDKGLGDIRLSELLTHRSGIIEAKSEPAAYKDRPVFQFIYEKLSMGTGSGKGAYLNSGFTLMEEIINLTSDYGYENELKVRIFDKCELIKTGDLHKSEEALARVGKVVLAPGMKIPMKDEVSQVFQEYDFVENEPLGRVPLSAGGLSSTVNDMEKYSVELVKMIVGQPSALTADLEEDGVQKIKEIYISSADKEMGGASKEGDYYSFGVEMHAQKDGTFVVQHGGNFAANAGMMSVTASGDRREFFPTISMNKSDYLTQTLVNEGSQTAAIVLEYFNSKLSMEEQKQFSTMSAKENFLIQQRRLPIEFINSSADQPSLRDQIFAGFGGFRQEMSNHLISAGYLNEDGVIDHYCPVPPLTG